MSKIADLIKKRKPELTPDELAGVKSRLIFAGVSEDLQGSDTALAADLMDKLVLKMRQSSKNIEEFGDQSSTAPRLDAFTEGAAEGKCIAVSLVNGRIATFNAKNNVVMPSKKTA